VPYGTPISHSPGIRGPPAACLTRCSNRSGPGCCSRMKTHVDGLCERRASHESTSHLPPFSSCAGLARPPVACCQSALFHVCPAFPQRATAAKAVAESACWSGTNEHSITPRLPRCCNCSRASDKIDTSQPPIPQPSFFTWSAPYLRVWYRRASPVGKFIWNPIPDRFRNCTMAMIALVSAPHRIKGTVRSFSESANPRVHESSSSRSI
jgi:hypothetical protein